MSEPRTWAVLVFPNTLFQLGISGLPLRVLEDPIDGSAFAHGSANGRILPRRFAKAIVRLGCSRDIEPLYEERVPAKASPDNYLSLMLVSLLIICPSSFSYLSPTPP